MCMFWKHRALLAPAIEVIRESGVEEGRSDNVETVQVEHGFLHVR